MKIGLAAICLLSVSSVLNGGLVCETCSHSGCGSPIYHCPLGTHCIRNCTIPVATENTTLIRIHEGKQFNVELPIAAKREIWILNPIPSKNAEILYQGPALNDPELFIFNFRAKNGGNIELLFQKVGANQPLSQGKIIEQPLEQNKAEKKLEEKHIMVEVIPLEVMT